MNISHDVAGLAELISPESHVVYMGAGLRVASGLPTFKELITKLLLEAGDLVRINDFASSAALSRPEQYDNLIELLEQDLSRSRLVSLLSNAVRRPAEPPPIYAALANIPFAGVITHNIDALAERAFLRRNPLVATPKTIDNAVLRLDQSPFIVLKLHGDSLDHDSVLLTTREFQRTVRRTPNIERLLGWMLQRHAVFFAGATPDTIQDLLSQFADVRRARSRHIALLASETATAAVKRLLLTRYGVRVLEYDATNADSLLASVRELSLRLGRQPKAGRVSRSASSHDPEGPLTRVRLRNIGPFERADVRLDRGWNVLLGDNGAGKSTCLRAIALALAGDIPAAQVAAAGLLNTGAKSGSIQLSIGAHEFRTELLRTARGVRLESTDVGPLDTVRRAALGFPALRGISASELPGPSTLELRGDAKSGGLIPLLLGDADSRLNEVEQLIVNAFAAERLGSELVSSRHQARRFAAALFHGLKALTPGLSASLAGIDSERWKVLVETADGTIPMDLLSQGMRSTYNWVGELYRKLFEVYPQSQEPQMEPVLVLVDELDVHLHPEWQQHLAPTLTALFPQAQFVATSHSPLVVSSLDAANLIIAGRATASSRATLKRRKIRAQHLRADQLLTSDLFGLRTSRGPSFQAKIDRYVALADKRDRTMIEEAEFVALRQDLSANLPSAETTSETEQVGRLKDQVRELESLLTAAKASPALDEQLTRGIAEVRRILRQNDPRVAE